MIHTDTINDTADERISSKFDYKVEQVPLLTQDGQATRFFGTRRTDTGEVFATVTDRYEILQNETLLESSENLFKGKGLNVFKRKEVVTHGGARMRALYDFPNIGAKVDGQDLTFRLAVQNSFDGSLRASFQVGMVRLICTNGMAAPVNTLNLTRKHTSSLDVDFVGRALDHAVESFHNAIPAFQRMSEMPVSMKDGSRILFNLADRKVMSERHAEAIETIWKAPTYKEDSKRNLWNLYNACTQHFTHNVEAGSRGKPRFELAERLNSGVMNTMVRAVRSNRIEDLLITLN
jgi:hypothetical protein